MDHFSDSIFRAIDSSRVYSETKSLIPVSVVIDRVTTFVLYHIDSSSLGASGSRVGSRQ